MNTISSGNVSARIFDAQITHILYGTWTRWKTKPRAPKPKPKPGPVVGKRIHLNSKNGMYIFLGYDRNGNIRYTTNAGIRDNEEWVTGKRDFKCMAGGLF